MLDLAVLGLLRSGPRHGYDLKRYLAELGFRRISFGSLYPALRRLEKRGLIVAVRSGGRRKSYRLTEDGSAELDRLLQEEPDSGEEDGRFSLRLAFFRYIEPALRIRSLERRRRDLVERLGETRRSLRRAKGQPADRYTLALMRRSVITTQADIEWLDELIAAERGSTSNENTARASTGGIEWETSR